MTLAGSAERGQADIFSVRTVLYEGLGGFPPIDIDETSSANSGPVTLSRSLEGMATTSSGTCTSAQSASGNADFGPQGLELGIFASTTVTPFPTGPSPCAGSDGYTAAVNVYSTFEDEVTVTGGPTGTPAFLRLTIAVEGAHESIANGIEWVFADTDALLELQSPGGGVNQGLCFPPDPDCSNLSTWDLEYRFDEPGLLQVQLTAITGAFYTVPFSSMATVDFSHTVRLVAVQVLDANKHPLPCGVIISTNGLSYPPADVFLCYGTKITKGTPKFEPELNVSLTDRFESGTVDILKLDDLCNPACQPDATIHLEGYQSKPVSGSLPHVPQNDLYVRNGFGTLIVDTVKPDRLFVPTAKSLTEPVDPPDPASHDVDHYKCYTVKVNKGVCEGDPTVSCKLDDDCAIAGGPCNLGFPKGIQTALTDQFNQPKVYDIQKPARLCVAVDKRGEGRKNPEASLMCYQAKPAKGEPQHVPVKGLFVNNQFGPERLDTIKDEEVCVESIIALP
jgi:hypothetical protein